MNTRNPMRSREEMLDIEYGALVWIEGRRIATEKWAYLAKLADSPEDLCYSTFSGLFYCTKAGAPDDEEPDALDCFDPVFGGVRITPRLTYDTDPSPLIHCCEIFCPTQEEIDSGMGDIETVDVSKMTDRYQSEVFQIDHYEVLDAQEICAHMNLWYRDEK